MSEFAIQKLSDVVEQVIDNRGRNPKSYEPDGIPVIDNYLITSDGEANLTNVKRFINEATYDSFLRKYVQENDVLMTLVGNGYGKVSTTPKERCAIIQNTIGLRCNEQNNNQFLYYLLRSNRESLMNLNRGAAQPSIKVGDILDLEFKFPSLHTQEQIANILGTIDKKILVNRQTNQTLENIAQAIFKSWFVDFEPTRAKVIAKEKGGDKEAQSLAAQAVICGAITLEQLSELPTGLPRIEDKLHTLTMERFRNTPSAGLDKWTPESISKLAGQFPNALVDSELGEIPAGWVSSTLGEHFNLVMGQSPKGDTYNEDGEGMLFFQGRRDFGFRYPVPRVYTTEPKRLAQAGDTLISVRAPVGDRNMAAQESCLGRGVAGIRHKSGARSFTYAFIGHIEAKLSDSGSDGTVFSSINKNELGAVGFVAPTKNVMTWYEEKVSFIDQQVEVNSQEIETLENLRNVLLPKLLSGELLTESAKVNNMDQTA